MSTGWEIVQKFDSEPEATLAAGFLESQGMEVRLDNRLFRQEPVNFGLLGAVRVQVRPHLVEEARRLLAELSEKPAEPALEESTDEVDET